VPAAIVAFSPGSTTPGRESIDTKAGIDPFFTRASHLHTGAMYFAGHEIIDDAHMIHPLDSHMPAGKDSPVEPGDTRPERPSHVFTPTIAHPASTFREPIPD
jgi:hypothetical protein